MQAPVRGAARTYLELRLFVQREANWICSLAI